MEDRYDAMVNENYALLTNMHDQCYVKCSEPTSLPYLTIKEGVCLRNCFTKFANWYPKLDQQTRDAAYRTYWELTEELKSDLKQ